MKKILLTIVIVVAVVVAAGLFYADTLAQRAIERGSSYAFGTPVSVGGVSLGLLQGEFGVSSYAVENPGEFDAPALFTVEDARLSVGFEGLTREQVTAQSLTIRGVDVYLLMEGGQSNFGPVLEHLRALGGGAETDQAGAGPRLAIQQLRLEEIRLHLGLPGIQRDIELPPVQLENVGGEAGLPIAQLAGVVYQQLLQAALNAGVLPGELSAVLSRGVAGLEATLLQQARETLGEDLEEQARKMLEDITGGDDP